MSDENNRDRAIPNTDTELWSLWRGNPLVAVRFAHNIGTIIRITCMCMFYPSACAVFSCQWSTRIYRLSNHDSLSSHFYQFSFPFILPLTAYKIASSQIFTPHVQSLLRYFYIRNMCWAHGIKMFALLCLKEEMKKEKWKQQQQDDLERERIREYNTITMRT